MGRSARIGASRLLVVWVAGGALAFGQQAAKPTAPASRPEAAAAAPPAVKPDVDVDGLLAKWEEQSAKLKTLDVVIFRTDVNPAWEEVEYFEGRAIFKAPNLAYIDFKKIKQDENQKPIRKEDKTWDSVHEERILCTGDEVWQYRTDTKQIVIFPMEKDQAARAIEEGPLPFLFNMKADDAKRRYTLAMMTSQDDKTYNVSIKPKLDVDRESFSQAFVQLDRSYMLPIRIVLISPNGKDKKDFRLGPIKPNEPVNEANFEGKLFANWKVVRNPMGEELPKNAQGAARPAPADRAAPADRQGQAARPRQAAAERPANR